VGRWGSRVDRGAQWPAWTRSVALGTADGGLLVADGSSRSILSAAVPSEARKSYGEYYHRTGYVLAAVVV
jgi:hypothetical protein